MNCNEEVWFQVNAKLIGKSLAHIDNQLDVLEESKWDVVESLDAKLKAIKNAKLTLNSIDNRIKDMKHILIASREIQS